MKSCTALAMLMLVTAAPAAAESVWDAGMYSAQDISTVGRWGELYTGEKVFGDDCSGGWECFSGMCVWTPNGQVCSRHCEHGCPDGWECGVCADWCPFAPLADVCLVPCASECSGKSCGDDGCGGSCGLCEPGTKCGDSGSCEQCTASCEERTCGSDGCGGSCGPCDDGFMCTPDGKCTETGLQPADGDEKKSAGGCSAAPGNASSHLAMLFLAAFLLALRRRTA